MDRPALEPPARRDAAAAAAPVPSGVAAGRPAPAVCISSAQLFAGAREVQIDHRGAVYRLKHTALGKLILTK